MGSHREFNEHGFGGTDTNRIARRAGFAPQTFYRWFKDKAEIFIQTYRRWQHEELDILRRLLAEGASGIRVARPASHITKPISFFDGVCASYLWKTKWYVRHALGGRSIPTAR